MSPLQEQARSVFTHFSFQKFQQEFERSALYSIDHENDNVFVLRFYKDINSRKHEVFWDGKIATCSCKHFEFWGILCRHILSIFLHKDCHEIPSNYLSSRWLLQAPIDDKEVESPIDDNVVIEEQVIDSNNEAHSQHVNCPPNSKTKGRPKRRRVKGGKELSHSMITCGFCKELGHNIVTCTLRKDKEEKKKEPKKQKKEKKVCEDENLNPILLPKV
jgi:hypothetical protein